MISEVLNVLFLSLTILTTAYVVRHYIFTFSVLRASRKQEANVKVYLDYRPTVSLLIPARNEERVLGRLLQRITELTYPKDKLQAILVDDASKDRTGKIAEGYARRYGYIEVVNRSAEEGGRGKPSALNSGMRHATGEIILCFDADYYPQIDIVEKLVKAFADPKVGAVQGRVTVLNEPRNLITRLVALERIGGYRVDQQARDSLRLIPQFGGTAGGIRRSLLEHLGGWDESCLAEDTDLTFRLYLAGYKIRYVNEAECYEEAVESWRAYWKQRHRWAVGHMQCFFKHSFKVLKSCKLSLGERIDGLLLLNVYFMPVLALLSWILGISLFFLRSLLWVDVFWAFVPISFYSFVGNFAPFFEVGIGAYLDGRRRAHWLISLLIFAFLLNVLICVKALADLSLLRVLGKSESRWVKTVHFGDGNSYIMN